MLIEVILIEAVTVDGFIARHSREVTTWSKDLHLFKEQTLGHPVVMGSNTYDTLAAELEGRKMIVVHRNDNPISILESIKEDKCFIIGGGIANVFDRIVYGSVTDFFHIDLGGGIRTGIFNVADMSVTSGMIMLVIASFIHRKKETNS